MRVIPPMEITDSILTSSNVSEPDLGNGDAAAWNSGTTYAQGDTASIITGGVHRVYESLQAGNLNHLPPTPPIETNEYWIEVGPTNRWAMFDLFRNSQTERTSPIEVELTPGQRVNSIAILGLEAT